MSDDLEPLGPFDYWTAGVASLERKVARLEAELDHLYEVVNNPGRSFSDVKQRRIDMALNASMESGELMTPLRQVEVSVQAAVSPRREAA